LLTRKRWQYLTRWRTHARRLRTRTKASSLSAIEGVRKYLPQRRADFRDLMIHLACWGPLLASAGWFLAHANEHGSVVGLAFVGITFGVAAIVAAVYSIVWKQHRPLFAT